jgi:putative ABC transport system permease protein
MLRHNLLLIFRNFKRFKSTFFINLIGLSTGLACALMIYLWVNDELAIDTFHAKDARLYQLMERQKHTNHIGVTGSTPWLLAEALVEEIPEIEYAATATPGDWYGKSTLSVKDKNIKAGGIYCGKDFFNIFSYHLVQGNPNQVLANKNSIVISEDLAKKLFDTPDNAVGKAIEFQHNEQYQVSGIFKNVPSNSSEKFDFVLSYRILLDRDPGNANWGNSGPHTFVVLKEGTNPEQFAKKIEGFIKTKNEDAGYRSLFIKQYSKNYLYGRYDNGIEAGGRIEYVYLFSLIAVFILLIACINFMNLSTAKASRRIKEVGIKKAIGAGRNALAIQYLGESMLMTFLSVAVAILMIDLLLPQFNLLTGKQLELTFTTNLLISIFAIMVITGLIAGSYPALYLSGFNPATVLKGKLNSSLGELWARKGLVLFQFTLSVILIVCVMVVYRQIQYVQNKNLGYDRHNVVYFEIEGKIKESLNAFLTEVQKIPGIQSASSISQSTVGGGNTTSLEWEGKDPDVKLPIAIRSVNYGVIEMLNMQMKDGRAFSKSVRSDSLKIILNESAVDAMGLKDPVGRIVGMGPYKVEILGVMKNFHFESLHSGVAPMFFVLAPQYTEKVIVKIEPGRVQEALANLQKFYLQFNPGFAFDYRFLDQDYQAQYTAETRVASLSRYFATLAIVISCLGLFGLAAFTAERRIKEIGIRKVLGSSEWGIVYLLSGDFTKIVVVAIVIALPVSYMITRTWLDNFAFKIPLEFWYFISAGALVMVISWLTVGTQAFKAARVSPTKCLKDE